MDSPRLDLSDAAIKELIRSAKKRGYVTHDQINSVLPSEEVNSEQIEDVLAMFSEMGVNVVSTISNNGWWQHGRSTTCARPNYCRESSSFSVLRWAAMAALLTFGFSERDCSNA